MTTAMTPAAPKAVLLDLEGTLYASGSVLPGAVDALAALRETGLGLRFLTNTDSKTTERILSDLSGYGLGIEPHEIFTPVVAARRCVEQAPRARVRALVSHALGPLFPDSGEGAYTHVLVGDCRDTLDYANLDAAFRAVRDGAELIALQRGRYFKRADGDHIDTGAIVAALEYAAGVSARVLGKPALDFFTLAAESAGVDVAACVVVGDDATTDIAGGRAAGTRTVQVRTGKYADQEREGLTGHADHTVDSIAELPGLLRALAAA